ncbi:hypothetical protein MGN01_45250 [Methylobacterium gnaphalii]|uniref:Uncharacterized protein n=1 Tax=Methylobacterium gnaphalii TaxID=1010610 RepID=A0A512JRU8_9HYPH|nr:hypothetical protein MGN01_45250 [Methylobacterium gnaphalii]GLS51703.1 hypothetical protein GCM10007885_45640 [Methylobacterium gnaphalii]
MLFVAALPALIVFSGRTAEARPLTRCDPRTDCPGRRPPGAPDRDARPFEGTLGRPCGYRWRYAPSGTRKVRVCF